MRLSALVIASTLLISVSLLAQRGGGGASSGGSHSGGGSSAGSSHGGSVGSAGSSRGTVSSSSGVSSGGRGNSSSAGAGRSSSERSSSERSSSERSSSERSSSLSERSPKDPARTGLNIRPNLFKQPVSEKLDEKPEKKGVFSFLHHKKPAPEPPASTPFHCKRGQNCAIPVRTACQAGRVWNSSSCAVLYDPYSWFNACRSLADQLAIERERMRMGNDPGDSFRYQMMLNQYRQCMNRFGAAPFSSYLFNDASFYPYF